MPRRPTPGEIYAFDLEPGYAALLVTHDIPKEGFLVWVAAETFASLPTVEDVTRVREWRWPTFISGRSLVSYPMICRVVLPDVLQAMPAMRPSPPLPRKPDRHAWKEVRFDGESNGWAVTSIVGPTRNATLPVSTTINDVAMRERIASGWRPQDMWGPGLAPVAPAEPAVPIFTPTPLMIDSSASVEETSTPVRQQTRAMIHLNDRMQPLHRGDRYEDPLDAFLTEHLPGSTVIGGGTEFTPETGPLSCDIEIELSGPAEDASSGVIEFLEARGAPIGSWLESEGRPRHPFGLTHER